MANEQNPKVNAKRIIKMQMNYILPFVAEGVLPFDLCILPFTAEGVLLICFLPFEKFSRC